MATFKLIKTTAFKANGNDHQIFTVAHSGRVFGLNTLYWEDEGDKIIEVDEKKKTVTLNKKAVIRKRDRVDEITGEVVAGRPYLDLMPKCDLELAAF